MALFRGWRCAAFRVVRIFTDAIPLCELMMPMAAATKWLLATDPTRF